MASIVYCNVYILKLYYRVCCSHSACGSADWNNGIPVKEKGEKQ